MLWKKRFFGETTFSEASLLIIVSESPQIMTTTLMSLKLIINNLASTLLWSLHQLYQERIFCYNQLETHLTHYSAKWSIQAHKRNRDKSVPNANSSLIVISPQNPRDAPNCTAPSGYSAINYTPITRLRRRPSVARLPQDRKFTIGPISYLYGNACSRLVSRCRPAADCNWRHPRDSGLAMHRAGR